MSWGKHYPKYRCQRSEKELAVSPPTHRMRSASNNVPPICSSVTTFPFLLLPLELRQCIYELLIEEAVIPRSPSLWRSYPWQSPSFSTPDNLNLDITTTKIRIANLKLPSTLLFVSRQIYTEFSFLIHKRVHHLRVTGDFLMGLIPIQPILDAIVIRPWISTNIRSIRIASATCSRILRGNLPIHGEVLLEHCWFEDLPHLTQLNITNVSAPAPERRTWLSAALERMGLSKFLGLFKFGSKSSRKAKPAAKTALWYINKLPDIAQLLEYFPLLERIDLETDYSNMQLFWPNPMSSTECFLQFYRRGIEVDAILRGWQMWAFSRLMQRYGMSGRNVRLWDESGEAVSERVRMGLGSDDTVARYRIFDSLPRENEEVVKSAS